jgi:hypothetical protein
MIQPVEYDGITWRVGFEYIPRREACKAQGGPTMTICRILPDSPRKTLVGEAHCGPGDKPSYEIGRKLALARALAGEPKDFRTAVWQAYLGRKKPPQGPYAGWSEGMIRLRDQIRQLTEILEDCQDILGRYLPPDGLSADQAISELLGVLDNSQTIQVIRQIGKGDQ